MEELWRSGESSVRSVMDALNRVAPKQRAYTTYMTIMARLHKKGLLSRRREGKTDYYAPEYARDDYLALRSRVRGRGARRPVRGRRSQPLRTPDGGARPGASSRLAAPSPQGLEVPPATVVGVGGCGARAPTYYAPS